MFRTIATAASLFFATPLFAQEESSFVEANILGIFYHELGHAVIDIESVPIFGQEEDAADVFSIYLIDAFYEEETAQALAYEAAFGFLGEAESRMSETDEIPWWDTHGADEQRYYNTVCIFYGADPEARHEMATDLGLPQDRAEYCPEEFDQANASWGAVLDDLIERGPGQSIRFEQEDDSLTDQILAQEIEALNSELSLSQPLNVRVESCGEANAFYDPQDRSIIFCTEFEDHLRHLERILN